MKNKTKQKTNETEQKGVLNEDPRLNWIIAAGQPRPDQFG